jgi:hypothetical protein
MNYDQKDFVGKKILLYPVATFKSYGTILKVDDLGFTVKITKAHERATFQAGQTVFISHSKGFEFVFMS